jgi:hypothetical protein
MWPAIRHWCKHRACNACVSQEGASHERREQSDHEGEADADQLRRSDADDRANNTCNGDGFIPARGLLIA